MAASQHRRVFVGNIPYDATDEQLIQIFEEVGPVVSFRLVVNRETGKPKGYGICEYKDDETALSACRNLQGYEINGRQLRVDFAENDKGSERSREQACLGGTQAVAGPSKNGPLQQPLGHDPLTVHLAKTSKSQPIQVMSEMKVLATENYDLACPNSMTAPLGMSAGPSKVNNIINTSNRIALTPIERAKRKRKSTTMSCKEHIKFVRQTGEKMLSLMVEEGENSFSGSVQKNYDFEDCYPLIERLVKEGLMVEESKLWCFTVTKLCDGNSRQAFMIMTKDSMRMAWLKFEYETTHKVVYTP